jgi:acetylornithine/succinyldiaminopimelate/putrescine aminotransferase/predicted amino acid dehydrogenase
MVSELSRLYQKYCKPELGTLFQIIGLDRHYTRGKGDTLTFLDDEGHEREVLDLLGGFGASLFGHNHPELVAHLKEALDRDTPFNAQASCRGGAAFLARTLSDLMQERFDAGYVSTFVNTGAEAVEAAIKHAEMERGARIEVVVRELDRADARLRRAIERASASALTSMLERLGAELADAPFGTADEALQGLMAQNRSLLDCPPVFVALERAFHGKSSGALRLTHAPIYRVAFEKLGQAGRFVPVGDGAALREQFIDATQPILIPRWRDGSFILERVAFCHVAGVFIEPIQGEGGARPVSAGFAREARDVCDGFKVPLIFDEIQCGMGRTGTFVYAEQLGVKPDYLLLSKSLGGSLTKIAALMVDRDRYISAFSVLHTSTFAEDELSTTVAAKAIELLTRDGGALMARAAAKGRLLLHGLRELQNRHPGVIADVRGAGLMIGVEFRPIADDRVDALQVLTFDDKLGYAISGYLLHQHSIRVAPTLSDARTIRIEPSAYVTDQQIAQTLEGFERLCVVLARRNSCELMRCIVGLGPSRSDAEIADYRPRETPKLRKDGLRKVAFIGHYVDAADIVGWDRSFEQLSSAELRYFSRRVHPVLGPFPSPPTVFGSVTGEKVEFNFIGLFLTSEIIYRHMKNGGTKPLVHLIERAVQTAVDRGCQAVGLGGYTSILTSNCESVSNRAIALTSGNSLTVAMGMQSIELAAAERGIDLGRSTVAIIGAAGNIGSAYAQIMAHRASRLILIGRQGRSFLARRSAGTVVGEIVKSARSIPTGLSVLEQRIMERVGNRADLTTLLEGRPNSLYDAVVQEFGDEESPIVATGDIGELRHADVILAASNTEDAIIFPNMLGGGPVVINDISTPMDTHESVRRMKNVTLTRGGLVQAPMNSSFELPGLPLPPGVIFACMAETMLMGLEDIREDFSLGKVEPAQVDRIQAIADKHGFHLAGHKCQSSF